jgi:hypothetical protein
VERSRPPALAWMKTRATIRAEVAESFLFVQFLRFLIPSSMIAPINDKTEFEYSHCNSGGVADLVRLDGV